MKGRQTCSHFCSNSVDNNVLCQVDTKLKYLIIGTIYVTKSQFSNLIKSFQCQKNGKMPKMSNTEPYRKHSWYFREENVIAVAITVPG